MKSAKNGTRATPWTAPRQEQQQSAARDSAGDRIRGQVGRSPGWKNPVIVGAGARPGPAGQDRDVTRGCMLSDSVGFLGVASMGQISSRVVGDPVDLIDRNAVVPLGAAAAAALGPDVVSSRFLLVVEERDTKPPGGEPMGLKRNRRLIRETAVKKEPEIDQ
ncbi:hypothetical protein HPB52_017665 [Rhipicephalus sanguineus]|uniref:Uncharacterized protein n=1 Tax=Rhipicephalus sanguineus TaxID=34632 RepID=A0A9D4TB36_RHISA|nr:hypothetical protein HPB52_017665 [Rhipicephalus sanguineus]